MAALAFATMVGDLRAKAQRRMDGTLPGWFGLEVTAAEHGRVEARLDLRPEFIAPNGYLHAGTVVTLADTCCGLGCELSLSEPSTGFTTVELKVNLLRTARAGEALLCQATASHLGRTTQVWDARVERASDGRPLALFRCTQYLLGHAAS